MIESVLYQSPYSGCGKFSGWPKSQPVAKPTPWVPAGSKRNAPGTLIALDSYRPGWAERRVPLNVLAPAVLPPRATVTLSTPTQNGRFTIAGPSTAGPLTYIEANGETWEDSDQAHVGGLGASGHNLGLA